MSQQEVAADRAAVMGICVCVWTNEDEWIHKLTPLQKANTSVVLSLDWLNGGRCQMDGRGANWLICKYTNRAMSESGDCQSWRQIETAMLTDWWRWCGGLKSNLQYGELREISKSWECKRLWASSGTCRKGGGSCPKQASSPSPSRMAIHPSLAFLQCSHYTGGSEIL